jgi:ketosteroid isomerase-like protein
MAGRSDALRERYQLFRQGDLERALDLWSDDFVWEGSNASDLPGSGRHEGKQAAIEVLQRAVAAWDKFEFTADEFVTGMKGGRCCPCRATVAGAEERLGR